MNMHTNKLYSTSVLKRMKLNYQYNHTVYLRFSKRFHSGWTSKNPQGPLRVYHLIFYALFCILSISSQAKNGYDMTLYYYFHNFFADHDQQRNACWTRRKPCEFYFPMPEYQRISRPTQSKISLLPRNRSLICCNQKKSPKDTQLQSYLGHRSIPCLKHTMMFWTKLGNVTPTSTCK